MRHDNRHMHRIVIATRESRLARWQAEHVQSLLARRLDISSTLLGMTTRGDQILDRTLAKVGGKGLFVKELELALERGDAHLAVHSLKDVPMHLPEGFALAAVLEREDPRDAFVSNRFGDIDALPRGALVGPTFESPHCAATSIPGSPSSMPVTTTRSCWPPPVWCAWDSATASGRASPWNR
jgi:hypothetical protein